MTPELQKYYEDRFSMMATQGWLDLIEDIDEMVNALNNLSAVEDEKKFTIQEGRAFYLAMAEKLATSQLRCL